MKKRRLNNNFNILMVVLISICLFVSLYLVYTSVDFDEFKNNKMILKFNAEENVQYHFNLFENNIHDEESFKQQEAYIASLIDNINIKFHYNFNSSEVDEYTYTYKIEQNVTANYLSTADNNQDKSIWNEQIMLVEPVTKTFKGSGFVIDEEVPFNFSEYRDLMIYYRNQVGFKAATKASIRLDIEITGNVKGEEFIEEDYLLIEIPLNLDVFTIQEVNVVPKKTNVRVYENPQIKIEKVKFLISSFVSIILVLLEIIFIRRIRDNHKNHYMMSLDRILKEYGDVIIEVITPQEFDPEATIIVKNFNEMIDLEERLRIPINFYEIKKNKEGLFWVKYNDQYYKYVLKNK